jgi:DNA-binding transcriptional MocR family regulator
VNRSTFKLLLYVPIQDNLALVDTLVCEDKDELVNQAIERKGNNPSYTAVLLTYELSGAEIVEVEMDSDGKATEV